MTTSLTPPDVKKNFVLDNTIDEILQAYVNGKGTIDVIEIKITIFLDFIGYVSNSPVSSEFLDFRKHGSLTPFPLCRFRCSRVKAETI